MSCVCDPKTGVKCMLHFDLDGYIIGKILSGDPEWVESKTIDD